MIQNIEDLIAKGGKFAPYWGWHDDHRAADKTEEYLPALQQVRAEFYAIVDLLQHRGSCLQLGLGVCDAPHEVWRCLFDHVVTIDQRATRVDAAHGPGCDTSDTTAIDIAHSHGPYDFLFVDAGHSYQEVGRDHYTYAKMVRPGGIIAFHDALPRDGYPEVEVWRYVQSIGVQVIGDEVGVAWLRR